MTDKSYSTLKLFLNAVSILLLGYGWYTRDLTTAIAGAVVNLLSILLSIIYMIIKSKRFKKDHSVEIINYSTDKISRILEGSLVIGSLMTMASKNELYLYPGQIIWAGQIIMFVVIGPILDNFAGIPMRMTYGGWSAGRPRKRSQK